MRFLLAKPGNFSDIARVVLEDEDLVAKKLNEFNFNIVEIKKKNNWLCMQLLQESLEFNQL